MGTTAATLHLAEPIGLAPDYAALLLKAYAKLGWGKPRRGEAAQRQVTLARSGDFVTVHDSACATLDDGTLTELAALLSRSLGAATVVTTLYDSDSFAFIAYGGGKQVDALGDAAEEPGTALKTVRGKRQATLWSGLFRQAALRRMMQAPAARIEAATDHFLVEAKAAATLESGFADDQLAAWCALAGLPFAAVVASAAQAAGEGRVIAEFALAPRPLAAKVTAAQPAGRALRFLHSPDDFPYHGFHPAAWPCAPGGTAPYSWPVTCSGGGLGRFTLSLAMSRTGDFRLRHASLRALSFFNGQVMSLTPLAQWEHRFGEAEAGAASITLEAPDFALRDPVPGSRAQVLLQLRLEIEAPAEGELRIEPVLHPDADAPPLPLPALRLAAIAPGWMPIIANTAALLTEQRAALLNLNAPSIHHAVAIVDDADAAREAIRGLMERTLDCFGSDGLESVVETEKHMTPSFRVPKSRQAMPLAALRAAAIWPGLFDTAGNHQTIRIGVARSGAAWPLAGLLLQTSLREGDLTPPAGGDADGQLHVALWANAAPEALAELGLDWSRMLDCFQYWARGAEPRQAWVADSAWIPLFSRYDQYEFTPYEVLGTSAHARMAIHSGAEGRAWMRERLKFVGPRIWLGPDLAARLDRAALEAVAEVTPAGAAIEIALRQGVPREALERALLPILPISR